ncbi:hypothetical protein [Nocardioides sp.]|uniref:hypothetical protein n=1 Tax=Nocardioides sp. TaxID=35761 RepID=UPI00351740CB
MGPRLRAALLSARPLLLALTWIVVARHGFAGLPATPGSGYLALTVLLPLLAVVLLVGGTLLLTGLVAPHDERLPRWHAWAARVLGPVLLLGTWLTASELTTSAGVGWEPAALLGLALVMAWWMRRPAPRGA